jgi:hypothetical protein
MGALHEHRVDIERATSVSLLNVETTVATEIGASLTNVTGRSRSTTSVPSPMNPETVKPKVWTPITAEIVQLIRSTPPVTTTYAGDVGEGHTLVRELEREGGGSPSFLVRSHFFGRGEPESGAVKRPGTM